ARGDKAPLRCSGCCLLGAALALSPRRAGVEHQARSKPDRGEGAGHPALVYEAALRAKQHLVGGLELVVNADLDATRGWVDLRSLGAALPIALVEPLRLRARARVIRGGGSILDGRDCHLRRNGRKRVAAQIGVQVANHLQLFNHLRFEGRAALPQGRSPCGGFAARRSLRGSTSHAEVGGNLALFRKAKAESA